MKLINNSQMLSKEQQNEDSMGNNDDTEHPANLADYLILILILNKFTQYKECPMLLPCFKYKEIIEISNLNNQFLNE